MTLSEYLKESGLSLAALAVRAGVSEAAMSRYVAGKRTPRPAILSRITEATAGKVQANDLYPGRAVATPGEAAAPALAGIEAVDLLIADMCGVLRGKRVAPESLPKVLDAGIRMPASIFALDVNGANISGCGMVWSTGDADKPVLPADGRLLPAPWSGGRLAQLLMTMREDDGQPFFADPRAVLGKVAARFGELGLTPVMAHELEFYLIEGGRAVDGPPRPPEALGVGAYQPGTQCYSLDRLDRYDEVLSEIVDSCAAQDVPADACVAEYSPGQFEVNLRHVADPVAAADHAVLLRRTVRAVARRHGLDATFMAKPYAEHAGSGLHLHVSLLDRQGRNIFDDQGGPPTEPLLQALGGLMATMPEAMAICAPNANSYRRFRAGSYAPLAASWGINNRTVALRVPGGEAGARRIEHRVAGADANPYLVAAAMLAGVHHGLMNRIDPGAPTIGNAYDGASGPVLPVRWAEALDRFAAGGVLPGYLGERFCRVFAHCRRVELQRFEAPLTPLDYAWYLRAF